MKFRTTIPSVEAVSSIYSYDPETGLFTRKIASYKAAVGSVAGTPDGKGYLKISILGKQYFSHRIAWLLTFGDLPNLMIDHKNGDGADNRISNLRLADHSGNGQNQRRAHDGSGTGLLGVCKNKRTGRFGAQIVSEGRFIWLGYYETAEIAHKAYLDGKAKLHPFGTLVGNTP